MQDDIISDILQRIAARCAPVALAHIDLTAIEMEVRRDWGGARPYVAKIGEAEIAARNARDEAICRAQASGMTMDEMQSRFGLSARRLREIVSEARK